MWGHLRAEEDALRETNPAGPLTSDASLQDCEKIDFHCVSRPVCVPAGVAEISPTRPEFALVFTMGKSTSLSAGPGKAMPLEVSQRAVPVTRGKDQCAGDKALSWQ